MKRVKKSAIMQNALVYVVTLIFLVLCLCGCGYAEADFLRIHIRADDNSQSAQSVKYIVKDAVVEYLSPFLEDATTKAQAETIVEGQLENLSLLCSRVLKQNGYDYAAVARLNKESFPTRSYGDVTLLAGVYSALIIDLGSGNGDNWWCVVYPPLCFYGGETDDSGNIVFKSKLYEIVCKWKEEHSLNE